MSPRCNPPRHQLGVCGQRLWKRARRLGTPLTHSDNTPWKPATAGFIILHTLALPNMAALTMNKLLRSSNHSTRYCYALLRQSNTLEEPAKTQVRAALKINHRMAKQPRIATEHQYCHTIPRQPRVSTPGTIFLTKHHQRQHPKSTPITPTLPQNHGEIPREDHRQVAQLETLHEDMDR
jgi:hypothetical protein